MSMILAVIASSDLLEDSWSSGVIVVVAVGGGVLVASILLVLTHRFLRRRGVTKARTIRRKLALPLLMLLPALALQFVLPTLDLAGNAPGVVQHIVTIALVVAVTWLLITVAHAVEQYARRHFDVTAPDNLVARQVTTQVVVMRRIATGAIAFVGAAAVLITFPRVRELGTGLLASAGIAGLVLGLAARPVVENLLAGIQLAFAQPIRLDDVVIVDDEWGRIEEIRSTFVVVRIWDDRRLIVPLSYFVQNTFQNWTRTTSDLLGTVFVYVDYNVPIDAVRAELMRVVEGSKHWDRRTVVLQVTDLTEQTVQLRALVSASNASHAFDLRCQVREALVQFLRDRYPAALPQMRIQSAQNGMIEPASSTKS